MATIKCKRFNFTKAELDALPVPAKRTWIYDTKVPQLGLTLLPSGTRSFHARATVHGQTKRIALENGKYPGMKVEQARNEAKRVLAQIPDSNDSLDRLSRQRFPALTCCSGCSLDRRQTLIVSVLRIAPN